MLKFFGKDGPFKVLIAPLDDQADASEWVGFPTTPEALREVFQRLEISSTQWRISDVDSEVPGVDNVVLYCDSLDEINYLAEKLVEMEEPELDTFIAVLESDQYNSNVKSMINLCDNLDCFYLDEDIQDYDDLSRERLVSYGTLSRETLDELDDFIDHEGYGRFMASGEGGFMSDSGYLTPSGIEFIPSYDGDLTTIPEGYRVTGKLDVRELTEDELMDRAMELAKELDDFFRVFDPEYAAVYPDAYMRQEDIFDCLHTGKIAALDAKLADMGQTSQDELPMELAEYKAAIHYDPSLDTEPGKLRVLVVEPRKTPYVKEIDHSPEALRREVGGDVQYLYPFDDPVGLICNDESKILGMELNRALYDDEGQLYDVVAGTFLVAGLDENHLASLPDELVEKFARRFQIIEVYAQVDGRIFMFQVPHDTRLDLAEPDLDRLIRAHGDRPASVRDRLAKAAQESRAHTGHPQAPKHDGPEL